MTSKCLQYNLQNNLVNSARYKTEQKRSLLQDFGNNIAFHSTNHKYRIGNEYGKESNRSYNEAAIKFWRMDDNILINMNAKKLRKQVANIIRSFKWIPTLQEVATVIEGNSIIRRFLTWVEEVNVVDFETDCDDTKVMFLSDAFVLIMLSTKRETYFQAYLSMTLKGLTGTKEIHGNINASYKEDSIQHTNLYNKLDYKQVKPKMITGGEEGISFCYNLYISYPSLFRILTESHRFDSVFHITNIKSNEPRRDLCYIFDSMAILPVEESFRTTHCFISFKLSHLWNAFGISNFKI